MDIQTPLDNREQVLIYKSVGKREIGLTFLPPINAIYEFAPVYFIIPGGGWYSESRESMLDFSASSVEALRRNGFAAVSIDYRVAAEDGIGIEETISDCFDAARYISHFARTLKINPDKLVVSGHSAGGHLALMLAYASHDMFRKDSTLTDDFAVVLAAPLSAPTILYHDDVEQTLNFNDEPAFKNDNSLIFKKKVSPYTYVSPESPATILCSGTSDRAVFSNSSELLYRRLKENGVKSKLVLSICGGHCFEQMHDGIVPSPSREEIQQIITEFILNNI